MFQFILPFLISVNSELTSYEITLSSPAYFDGQFKILSRNKANEHIFGYDKDRACFIRKDERHIFAYFQSVRTIERSAEVFFEVAGIQSPIILINCFKFNGNSFIIYKQQSNGETTIIRGNNEMRKLRNLNYDDIRYDHINEKLYLVRGHAIYDVEIEYFEDIWKSLNSSNYGVLKMNAVSILDFSTTDFLIFKNHIYFIKDFKIYKTEIGTKDVDFVSNSGSKHFNFITFETNNKVINADSSKLLLTILYIIDVIVIVIFVYFIKKKQSKGQMKYNEVPIVMEVFNKK
jgi:hypothetical protein